MESYEKRSGQVPGMERGDPADPHGAAEVPAEAEEAAEETDEPTTN